MEGKARPRIPFPEAPRQRAPCAVDLDIRLLPRRSGPKAGDGREVRSSAFALAVWLKRAVYVGVHGRDRAFRKHSHDRVGFSPQKHGPAKNAPIAAEYVAPHGVAQDHGLRSMRAV